MNRPSPPAPFRWDGITVYRGRATVLGWPRTRPAGGTNALAQRSLCLLRACTARGTAQRAIPANAFPTAVRLLIVILGFGMALLQNATAADPDADRIALAVDALTRLEGVDLNANATLKERVLKVLDKTRGTPNFVRLVQHFKLEHQNPGLWEVAVTHPAEESGVEAMRLLLQHGGATLAASALEGTNAVAAAKTAEALGNAGGREAARLLLPIVSDPQRDIALRRQAVRSLAKSAEGARELLDLAKAGQLRDDVKFTASSALNAAPWPGIQAEAAKLLPLPPGPNAAPFPPIAELLKRTGDVANGERVFSRQSPGCITCHVVRGQGTDFGPNLSEIGSKLGRDALMESILDPNAGISFGFEAFNIMLKNGDEAYGLIASETAEELSLKAVGGIVTKYKKSDVVSRQQSKLSIMPAGLQQAMTPQEFVDLIEFLASLKKP